VCIALLLRWNTHLFMVRYNRQLDVVALYLPFVNLRPLIARDFHIFLCCVVVTTVGSGRVTLLHLALLLPYVDGIVNVTSVCQL
jgi:hypothetical protein